MSYQLLRNQELQGFVAYVNFYLQLKASALRKAQKRNQQTLNLLWTTVKEAIDML